MPNITEMTAKKPRDEERGCYAVAAAFLALSKRMRLMHLVHARTDTMTPATGSVTRWMLGANDRLVVWARFFHWPPATPVWWVCCLPARVFLTQISQLYAIGFPGKKMISAVDGQKPVPVAFR